MSLRFLLLVCAAAIGSFAISLLALGKFPAVDLGLPSFDTAAFDPAVVNYPKEQVQTMLVEAKTTLPERRGPEKINIWGAGRSAKGVTLNMKYASWGPVNSCEAVVTEVAKNKSCVVVDCGGKPDEDAISKTQDKLRAPMFEEHVEATLNKREFNRANVDQKERVIVFSNLGAMQRAAMDRADEAARASQEYEESQRKGRR